MSGLEALKKLPKWLDDEHRNSEEEYFKASEEYKAIEKELKALEIIKKCPMFSLHDDMPQGTYKMYDCELYSHYDLTKDEFDLLKEVLE